MTHVFPKGKSECNWEMHDYHGVLYRPGPGKSVVALPKGGSLAGVVTVKGALRGVVSNEDGELRVYTPAAGGGLALTTDFRWEYINEEDAARHSLGPYCGP